MAMPTAASRCLPAREVQSGTAVAAWAARGLGGVRRSLPRETRLYDGGTNQITEMLAKELTPRTPGPVILRDRPARGHVSGEHRLGWA